MSDIDDDGAATPLAHRPTAKAKDAALIAAAPHLYLTLESCAASLERHALVVHVPTLQTFMRDLVIQIRTALADVDGVDKMPSQRRRKRTKKAPANA
ncbi:MAG: hypothetical protein FD149_2509 [Rhodospirillaceae bacterium]|nr:MAG: hypothetical protein FD149_2509 [Rhodospirillaceae bacterium]